MSLFGRGGAAGGGQAPSSINHDRIDMAMTELDTVTDFFNRMVQSCHAKCLSTRYPDAELNKGEIVCIDRCVAKFVEVQKRVGEKLQARGSQNSSSGGSLGTL